MELVRIYKTPRCRTKKILKVATLLYLRMTHQKGTSTVRVSQVLYSQSGLSCGVAGFGLDAPILGSINMDIGPDLNLIWVALSYLFINSVALMIVGWLSDLSSRRQFFIGGNTLAMLGFIVAATAPSISALIAEEALISLGAAVQLFYVFKSEMWYSEIVTDKFMQNCGRRDCPNLLTGI